jgi:hypothetical protein
LIVTRNSDPGIAHLEDCHLLIDLRRQRDRAIPERLLPWILKSIRAAMSGPSR